MSTETQGEKQDTLLRGYTDDLALTCSWAEEPFVSESVQGEHQHTNTASSDQIILTELWGAKSCKVTCTQATASVIPNKAEAV